MNRISRLFLGFDGNWRGLHGDHPRRFGRPVSTTKVCAATRFKMHFNLVLFLDRIMADAQAGTSKYSLYLSAVQNSIQGWSYDEEESEVGEIMGHDSNETE